MTNTETEITLSPDQQDDLRRRFKERFSDQGEAGKDLPLPTSTVTKDSSESASWSWFQSLSGGTYNVLDSATKQVIAKGLNKKTAVLIASAPALYAALNLLLPMAERFASDNSAAPEWGQFCHEARAALALATAKEVTP